MQVERLTDRIDQTIAVTEDMRIIHSVQISGVPIRKNLIIDYLRGNGPETSVQLTWGKRVSPVWDLAAIVNGDMNNDRLEGFCEFAKSVIDTKIAKKPVIALRHCITEHAAYMLSRLEPCVREDHLVTHSLKGPHKHEAGA